MAQFRACKVSRAIPLPLGNLARPEFSQFPLKLSKLQELNPCSVSCFLCKWSYFSITVKTTHPSFYFPFKLLLEAPQANYTGMSELWIKIVCGSVNPMQGLLQGSPSTRAEPAGAPTPALRTGASPALGEFSPGIVTLAHGVRWKNRNVWVTGLFQ